MKKKWIKITGIFATALLLGSVGGAMAYRYTPVEADGAEALLRTMYEYGETVKIPDGKIEYGGQTVDAEEFAVFFPDGSAGKQAEFDIEDYGLYTVRYYATRSGRKIYADKTFTVKQTLCSSNNENTTYGYGVNEEYKTGKGLAVSIVNGDELKINKLLDLSDSELSTSFIDFQFTPSNYGTTDAYKVYMKLTDAYDENNYIILRMQNWSDMGNWADEICYMDARAPGQEWTSTIEKDSDHHKRGENGKGWFGSYNSMTGRNSAGKRVYEVARISYDAQTKRLNSTGNYQGATHITDFDDPDWYDLSKEKLWDGFTTGECFVSFSAEKYTSGSLNLHITKLRGHDLTTTDFDEDAPNILVDYAEEEPTALPYARVGKAYKIYNATATDLTDGQTKVIVGVFYDYKNNPCLIDSYNGEFVPQKAGVYTIVYEATDKTGNVSYKEVEIECREAESTLSVSVASQTSTCVAGETVTLFDGVSVGGNNGKVSWSAELVGENGTLVLGENEYAQRFMESGEYTVKIIARDYVDEFTYSFKLTVQDNPTPIFDKTPNLPKYFIKGAKYDLPSAEALLLQGGSVQTVQADLFVTETNGQKTKITGTYTPANAGMATFVYEAKNGENISYLSFEMPVIDTNYGTRDINIGAYFYDGEGKVGTNVTEEYIEFCTSQAGDIDFINAVQAVSLELVFNVNKNYQNFNRFFVLLTDSENENVQIKVTYEKAGDNIYMYLNENYGVIKSLPSNFNETSTSNVLCNYQKDGNMLKGSNEVWYIVEKDLAGNAFNGFPSNKAYITVGFEQVTGESRLKIYNINNQTLYNISRDTARPQILANSAIGSLKMGTVVTLDEAIFSDVLDTVLTTKLEVTDPEGNYVRAVDGTLLNGTCDARKSYQILADKYGDYSVVYSCKDTTNSRETLYAFTFSVKDFAPPQVAFESAQTTAKRGETVTVANVVVSDDYSEKINTYFAVIAPNGTTYTVGEEKTFVADMVGVYTVYCYAFDEAGNSTFVSYTVVVE